MQTTDVSRAVVDVAAERGVDTVVLSSRRPFVPGDLRRGTLGRIIDDVHCDVIVVVDPTDGREGATRAAARHADAAGAVTFTELSTADAVQAVLATGDGADLVVLPLGAEDDHLARRPWSTTPVLAVVERPRPDGTRDPADPTPVEVAERVEEVVP